MQRNKEPVLFAKLVFNNLSDKLIKLPAPPPENVIVNINVLLRLPNVKRLFCRNAFNLHKTVLRQYDLPFRKMILQYYDIAFIVFSSLTVLMRNSLVLPNICSVTSLILGSFLSVVKYFLKKERPFLLFGVNTEFSEAKYKKSYFGQAAPKYDHVLSVIH